MNGELKQYYDEAKKLPSHLQKLISTKGIPTGSRVFGGAGPDSDYDFILTPRFDKSQLDPYLFYDQSYFDQEFRSFYVKTADDQLWNILFCDSDALFEQMVVATQSMEILYDAMLNYKGLLVLEKMLTKKSVRVFMFEAFKQAYSLLSED